MTQFYCEIDFAIESHFNLKLKFDSNIVSLQESVEVLHQP